MPLPSFAKIWTITPNNRIPFVSLNDTMATYLFGVKVFLKANGYTVKGSCNGVTGAMDAVDRWITKADVTTQGAGGANAQSWVVLIDGNGCNLLLTFQGGTPDVARISFSRGGVFVAAGTPNQQPTATDEAVISTGISLISSAVTQDRVWHGWVDSQSKLCRFGIARAGAWVGRVWGVELVSSVVTGAIVVWTPTVWGFAFTVGTEGLSGASSGGTTHVVAAAVPTVVTFGLGFEQIGNEIFNSNFWATPNIFPLQGGTGISMRPISIASTTAGARGKYGDLYDWWYSRTGGAHGDLFGSRMFITMGGTSFFLWPWDGVTAPQLT